MFSEKRLFDTQFEVARAGTVDVVENVFNSQFLGTELLSEAWIQATLASLVGFVVHGLIVTQVLSPSTGNVHVDTGLKDVIKVGTVLTVSQAINSSLKGNAEFSEQWMTSTAMNLAAFFAFNVAVNPYLPVIQGHQATVVDMAKAVFTSVSVRYFSGQEMDNEYMISLAGTVLGFAVYHELVHPRLFV